MNSKILASAGAAAAGTAVAAGLLTSCGAASAPAGNTPPAVRPLNGGTNMASVQWTPLPSYDGYSSAITTFCYAGVQFYVTETDNGGISMATAMQNGGSAGDC
jgi:hypothetical protein